MLLRLSCSLLIVFALLSSACSFEVTSPPPRNPNRNPNDETAEDRESYIRSLNQNIYRGRLPIHVRPFAQIPIFRGVGSRLVGLVAQGPNIYVTTSTSGALIYEIDLGGNVKLWANIQKAVLEGSGRNVNCVSSQHGGLRGVAFPPDFAITGLFYVSFMEDRPADPSKFNYFSGPAVTDNPDSVVAEFRYNYTTHDAQPSSYRQVLRIGNPRNDHTIKQMAFDGPFLLITHGDGSAGSQPLNGGMNNDALGKVIRINPRRSGKAPYQIPASNPFVGNPNYKSELYAIGFRNPHNICVSKKHGIFVTDAGRDNVEEVNIVKAGGNYGWQEREGTFVHLPIGGTGTGIDKLPPDDAKYGYIYPNVQIGHLAPRGKSLFGQALAGGCPVETNSQLYGIFMYANFPEGGELYYSWVGDMKRAVVQGPPNKLRQARVYNTTIYFDHDDNPATPPLKLPNLREVVRQSDNGRYKNSGRVDMRFGRGPRGEIFWTSKINGRIYLITNTLPGTRK